MGRRYHFGLLSSHPHDSSTRRCGRYTDWFATSSTTRVKPPSAHCSPAPRDDYKPGDQLLLDAGVRYAVGPSVNGVQLTADWSAVAGVSWRF
jgi:hypothetical protein